MATITEIEVRLLAGSEPFYVDITIDDEWEFYFQLRNGKLSSTENLNQMSDEAYAKYMLLTDMNDLEQLVNKAVDEYVESECAELRRMAASAKMKG